MAHLGAGEVKAYLQQYGIPNPSDAEVNMFVGMDVIGGSSGAAMAEYANFVKAENTRQANDPLVAYQQLEQKYASDSIAQAQNLYTQLQDLQSSAPKLFGELTPDQITQYLAPLQTAFKTSVSNVQSVLASRGLGASSTETGALAQANQQFQENVLSTGLNIGLTSQQNKANSMQAQINNLFGLGTSANAQAGQAAGQKSAQDLSQSNLIASLPYFLRSSGTQEAESLIAANKSTNKTGSTIAGGITGALSGAAEGFMVGGPWGAVAGGVVGGAAGAYSGSQSGSAPTAAAAPSAGFLTGLATKPGVNAPNRPADTTIEIPQATSGQTIY